MDLIKFTGLLWSWIGFANGVIPRDSNTLPPPKSVCGQDKSSINVVYEGYAKIETYPWLGVLYYPTGIKGYTTSVVLVTKQIVIGSAIDIDRLPKHDIRARSRIILGKNCTNKGIKMRDYTYHPDFDKATYSALALIQLETNGVSDLQPICAPPGVWKKPEFFAFAIDDCQTSSLKIYKMAYVDPEQCKTYYSETELDITKIWPTHTICARSLIGLECIWRNGVVMAMRDENKWHMIGFGIYGPGCRAPSRFQDYVQFKPWVLNSVLRIGRPTITRIAENQVILRRSLSSIQRYGLCDKEEIKDELFSDRTSVERSPTYKRQHINYNFTIFANLEYSCIIFKVIHHIEAKNVEKPYIRLRRWCISPKPICYSFQFLQIEFAVQIFFKLAVTYKVIAYGREVRLIDIKKLMKRLNVKKPHVEVMVGSDY